MKKPKGWKKPRGKKAKKRVAFHYKCIAYQKLVCVSDITEKGFWLHTPRKDYYLSRKNFKWFQNATDEEIRNVTVYLDVDDYHGDGLSWSLLDLDIGTNQVDQIIACELDTTVSEETK